LGSQRKIDLIDATILRALLKDARTSFVEISKQCKVQANIIRTHYNRLKQDGIITGEITEIIPESIGYNCQATLRLIVDPNKTAKVIDQLKSSSTILQVTKGFGGKNLLCFIATRDFNSLNKIVEHIKGFDGVTSTGSDLLVISDRGIFPENLQIVAEE
jgi:DNA-binding Lrp family transcriptional regulator